MCEVHKTPEEIQANKRRWDRIRYEKFSSPPPKQYEDAWAYEFRKKMQAKDQAEKRERLLEKLEQAIVQNEELHKEILEAFASPPEEWVEIDPNRMTDLKYLKSLLQNKKG